MPQLNQLADVANSQFFWLLLVLGVIYFAIGKGMLPKIQSTVDLREQRIAQDVAAAEAAQAEAEKVEADYRARMDASRAEAAKLTGKAKDDGKRVPLDVKAGDVILFGKYSGQEIKLDGEEYLIMREDEVLAVIDDAKKKK